MVPLKKNVLMLTSKLCFECFFSEKMVLEFFRDHARYTLRFVFLFLSFVFGYLSLNRDWGPC